MLVTLKDAAQLAGVNYNILRQARSRAPELWRSEYFGTPRKGAGNIRLVDRPGVIWLAIWGRMLAFGLAHRAAAEAAWLFTEMGEVVTGKTAAGPLPEPSRGPCELYPEGRTMLVVYPRRAGEMSAGVPLSGGRLAATLINWRAGRLGEVLEACGTVSPLIVDLNRLVAEIDAQLAALPPEMKQRTREAIRDA